MILWIRRNGRKILLSILNAWRLDRFQQMLNMGVSGSGVSQTGYAEQGFTGEPVQQGLIVSLPDL